MLKKIIKFVFIAILMGLDYFCYFLRKLVSLVLKSPAKDIYYIEAEKITNDKKWDHQFLNINTLDGSKLKIHFVTHTKSTANKRKKPLFLMVHGFPEMWYSWRYQLEGKKKKLTKKKIML